MRFDCDLVINKKQKKPVDLLKDIPSNEEHAVLTGFCGGGCEGASLGWAAFC